MNFKILLLLLFFVIFSGCQTQKKIDVNNNNFTFFSNKGFTLVYTEDLYKNKIINKKIEKRSLIVFNNKLNSDTPVRITNMLNGKYLLAKIYNTKKYPSFYNSVISERIAYELDIYEDEPYIKIQTVNNQNSFIANKAVTFEEEKKVATKAPVESITIENISVSAETKKTTKIASKKIKNSNEFKYIIKFADLYFEESAITLKNRLIDKFKLKNVKVKKLSKNSFRVFMGPFISLDSIKKSFDSINISYFDNLEIIKL